MKLMVLVAGIALTVVMTVALSVPVRAVSSTGAVIDLVQAAGSDVKFERIDVKNSSDETVDLTGWKLVYRSASGSSSTNLLEFTAEPGWHVLLDARQRETVVSKELALSASANSPLRMAEQFTAGMNHLGGGIQLVDETGNVVDMVGWGTASEHVRQGLAAPAMTSSSWLSRHNASGNNFTDYTLEPQDMAAHPLSIGSLYDAQDACQNLAGLQLVVPDDYQLVGGECLPIDACPNLDGIQQILPSGMEYDDQNHCQPIDYCFNLDGIQEEVPSGYEPVGNRVCEVMLPVHLLQITELLPNPSGSDEGNEFIELYNADNVAVELKYYVLMIGDKSRALPDVVLASGAYVTLSDSDLDGNLPNTTGVSIWLMSIRGVELMSVPAYMNAHDDVSWAWIGNQWQYTYAPSPGSENVLLTALPCDDGYLRDENTGRCRKVETTTVTPCRDGQYRSEETGRCRNLVVAIALAPCKEGQYRSEETNRCRSFATLAVSALKPCADDQFRNPLTNRCKSIASSDDIALADCGEGRERNPETNRCRNIITAAMPAAPFAVEPIRDTAAAFAGWWALGGVGTLALGYAGWEWRREVVSLITRFRGVLTARR